METNLDSGVTPETPNRLGFSDGTIAVVLAIAALVLYLATPIARGYGDGPNLIFLFADPANVRPSYVHALYLPLARLLDSGLSMCGLGQSPAETLLLYSQLSTALGIACSFLVVRLLGVGKLSAILAAVFYAISPPVWFYAGTPEVHAPHFGTVSFVALITLLAPWRKPILATALMVAFMPLLFLTHQTGIFLFPGWVLLVQLARRRVAPAFTGRTLLFRIAPAIAFSFGIAFVLNAYFRDIPFKASFSRSSSSIFMINGPILEGIWRGWLQPLALFWIPLALGALCVLQDSRARGTALALFALLVPGMLFFFALGVPERGGYSLGGGVFLVVLAGLGFARLAGLAPSAARSATRLIGVGAVLIVLQAGFAYYERQSFDDPSVNQAMRERVVAARLAFGETPAQKVLISFDGSHQTLSASAPEITEVRIKIQRILKKGASSQEFASNIVTMVNQIKAEEQVVLVLDRGYAAYFGNDLIGVEALLALDDLIEETFSIEKFAGPGGGFWRLDHVLSDGE